MLMGRVACVWGRAALIGMVGASVWRAGPVASTVMTCCSLTSEQTVEEYIYNRSDGIFAM